MFIEYATSTDDLASAPAATLQKCAAAKAANPGLQLTVRSFRDSNNGHPQHFCFVMANKVDGKQIPSELIAMYRYTDGSSSDVIDESGYLTDGYLIDIVNRAGTALRKTSRGNISWVIGVVTAVLISHFWGYGTTEWEQFVSLIITVVGGVVIGFIGGRIISPLVWPLSNSGNAIRELVESA
jgi:hypothetical protein